MCQAPPIHLPGRARAAAGALALALMAAWPAGAAEPTVIRSHSLQFVVQGESLGHVRHAIPTGSSLVLLDPSILAVAAETVRQTLESELHWGKEWRGLITIQLHPARGDNESILVHSIRASGTWNYRLEVPDEVDSFRLTRALVEVLLMEYANRKAGERPADLPPWLATGLAGHLQSGPLNPAIMSPNTKLVRSGVQRDPLRAARAKLQTNAPLSLSQLNWPEEGFLEGERLSQYEASSHLLVRELLRLRDGPACLRRLLELLPERLNWQLAFLQAYGQHFPRQLDVEKWWSLVLVGFCGRDPDVTWSLPESLRRLDEILYTPTQVRLGKDETPHESQLSLQAVLGEWEYEQQSPLLRAKIAALKETCPHFAPDCAALGGSYRKTLEQYLQERERADESTASSRTRPFSPTLAIVNGTIRQLRLLDLRRERLWNPAKVAPGSATRPAAPRSRWR